jgi:hypothetical protein
VGDGVESENETQGQKGNTLSVNHVQCHSEVHYLWYFLPFFRAHFLASDLFLVGCWLLVAVGKHFLPVACCLLPVGWVDKG